MSVGDPPVPIFVHNGVNPASAIPGQMCYDTSRGKLFAFSENGGWIEQYIPPVPNGKAEVDDIIKEIGYQKAAGRLLAGEEFEAITEAARENELIQKLLDRVKVAMKLVTPACKRP